MKIFSGKSLCLAIGLVGVIDAFPASENGNLATNTTADWSAYNATIDINNFGVDLSPTDKHQGQALAEVWIGRSARNVGDVTQDNLYNTIWQGLNKKCPQRYPGWCYDPNVMHFSTHAVSRTNGAFPIEIRDVSFGISIEEMQWKYEEIRKLLIGAVAGTMKALTKKGSSNCYAVPGHPRYCNVGDRIRINLPSSLGHENKIYVRIWGDEVYGHFRCCRDPIRQDVDAEIDTLGNEMSYEFSQPFSRFTNCMIDGWKTCNDCGPSCDSCGFNC